MIRIKTALAWDYGCVLNFMHLLILQTNLEGRPSVSMIDKFWDQKRFLNGL